MRDGSTMLVKGRWADVSVSDEEPPRLPPSNAPNRMPQDFDPWAAAAAESHSRGLAAPSLWQPEVKVLQRQQPPSQPLVGGPKGPPGVLNGNVTSGMHAHGALPVGALPAGALPVGALPAGPLPSGSQPRQGKGHAQGRGVRAWSADVLNFDERSEPDEERPGRVGLQGSGKGKNSGRPQASSAKPRSAGVHDEATMEGPCYLKMLMPNHIAGALIGKEGVMIGEILMISRCQMQISEVGCFFPGTTDRIVLMAGTMEGLAECIRMSLKRLSEVTSKTRNSSQLEHIIKDEKSLLTKLAVPSSAVSGLIGHQGDKVKFLSEKTQCRINMSGRVDGMQERLVLICGELDNLVHATIEVARQVQTDPHLKEHLYLKYDIKLSLGTWSGAKAQPLDPEVPLILVEHSGYHTKRELVEYLQLAAPREILLKHNLLGNMRNTLKSKAAESLKEAVKDTMEARMLMSSEVNFVIRPKPEFSCIINDISSREALPVGQVKRLEGSESLPVGQITKTEMKEITEALPVGQLPAGQLPVGQVSQPTERKEPPSPQVDTTSPGELVAPPSIYLGPCKEPTNASSLPVGPISRAADLPAPPGDVAAVAPIAPVPSNPAQAPAPGGTTAISLPGSHTEDSPVIGGSVPSSGRLDRAVPPAAKAPAVESDARSHSADTGCPDSCGPESSRASSSEHTRHASCLPSRERQRLSLDKAMIGNPAVRRETSRGPNEERISSAELAPTPSQNRSLFQPRPCSDGERASHGSKSGRAGLERAYRDCERNSSGPRSQAGTATSPGPLPRGRVDRRRSLSAEARSASSAERQGVRSHSSAHRDRGAQQISANCAGSLVWLEGQTLLEIDELKFEVEEDVAEQEALRRMDQEALDAFALGDTVVDVSDATVGRVVMVHADGTLSVDFGSHICGNMNPAFLRKGTENVCAGEQHVAEPDMEVQDSEHWSDDDVSESLLEKLDIEVGVDGEEIELLQHDVESDLWKTAADWTTRYYAMTMKFYGDYFTRKAWQDLSLIEAPMAPQATTPVAARQLTAADIARRPLPIIAPPRQPPRESPEQVRAREEVARAARERAREQRWMTKRQTLPVVTRHASDDRSDEEEDTKDVWKRQRMYELANGTAHRAEKTSGSCVERTCGAALALGYALLDWADPVPVRAPRHERINGQLDPAGPPTALATSVGPPDAGEASHEEASLGSESDSDVAHL